MKGEDQEFKGASAPIAISEEVAGGVKNTDEVKAGEEAKAE